MSSPLPLAQNNIAYLRQAMDLLETLPDEVYTRTAPPMFTSGIGSHYRHTLDHYLQFLAGWSNGLVDYDARARDLDIETDRAVAIAQTKAVIEGLEQLVAADGARPLASRMACGEGPSEGADSTVNRELQFLISHTVHHYALIAVLLRLVGREPTEGFGVAPSTLIYRKNLAGCAQ